MERDDLTADNADGKEPLELKKALTLIAIGGPAGMQRSDERETLLQGFRSFPIRAIRAIRGQNPRFPPSVVTAFWAH